MEENQETESSIIPFILCFLVFFWKVENWNILINIYSYRVFRLK